MIIKINLSNRMYGILDLVESYSELQEGEIKKDKNS